MKNFTCVYLKIDIDLKKINVENKMDDYGKNISQMLIDRGYKDPSLSNFPGLIFDIEEKLPGLPNSTDKSPEHTLGVLHSDITNIMIITENIDKWSKASKEWMSEMKGRVSEIFHIDYFIVNHPEFYLNPKLERNADYIRLNQSYGVEEPLLEWPLMSINDPLVRWYGFRVGEQVKVVRENRIDYAIVCEVVSLKNYEINCLIIY